MKDNRELKKIYEIYNKDTLDNLSEAEYNFINKYINSGGSDDIREVLDHIIYSKFEKEYPKYLSNEYNNETIWSFTDTEISNGQSGKENYDNLINYLKENDQAFQNK